MLSATISCARRRETDCYRSLMESANLYCQQELKKRTNKYILEKPIVLTDYYLSARRLYRYKRQVQQAKIHNHLQCNALIHNRFQCNDL